MRSGKKWHYIYWCCCVWTSDFSVNSLFCHVCFLIFFHNRIAFYQTDCFDLTEGSVESDFSSVVMKTIPAFASFFTLLCVFNMQTKIVTSNLSSFFWRRFAFAGYFLLSWNLSSKTLKCLYVYHKFLYLKLGPEGA